jgi:Ran GTPase-activating protein (RanGAP) involved in mRNA processing and transport
LVQALNSSGCEVRALGLSDNAIYITGAVRKLAEFLKSPNCKLTSLDLSDNDIDDNELQGLAEALISPNCRLTSLNLSDNHKITAIKFLTDLTGRDCKLTSLNLSNNLLLFVNDLDRFLRALFDFLNSPGCKVTSLNLSGNKNIFGDYLAEALAEFLKSPNCRLTLLELGDNNIHEAGSRMLAEAVVAAKHLSPERVIKIKGLPDFDRYLAVAEDNFGRQVQAHESAVAVVSPCCT